jgi:hypothetical protein
MVAIRLCPEAVAEASAQVASSAVAESREPSMHLWSAGAAALMPAQRRRVASLVRPVVPATAARAAGAACRGSAWPWEEAASASAAVSARMARAERAAPRACRAVPRPQVPARARLPRRCALPGHVPCAEGLARPAVRPPPREAPARAPVRTPSVATGNAWPADSRAAPAVRTTRARAAGAASAAPARPRGRPVAPVEASVRRSNVPDAETSVKPAAAPRATAGCCARAARAQLAVGWASRAAPGPLPARRIWRVPAAASMACAPSAEAWATSAAPAPRPVQMAAARVATAWPEARPRVPSSSSTAVSPTSPWAAVALSVQAELAVAVGRAESSPQVGRPLEPAAPPEAAVW